MTLGTCSESTQPQHYAGITPGQVRLGQAAIVHILHGITQVIQRHGRHANGFSPTQLKLIGQRAVNDQYSARHDLDRAHAQCGQVGRGYPGNEPLRFNLLGGAACQGAVIGRHIVNGDDGQPVFIGDAFELPQQPFAVTCWYGAVAAFACVIALEQRLGSNIGHLFVSAIQDFKATVKHQLGLWVAAFDLHHQRDHARFLLGFVFWSFGKQVVGVQRVKKEAAVACGPQRVNHRV